MTDSTHIDPASLLAPGAPEGMRFDREDLPALAREIDAACEAQKCAKPMEIVHSAEFAIRLHVPSGWFGARKATLGLGWPLMQVLDVEELRAALALALGGACVGAGRLQAGDDARARASLGAPLLARTLTRLVLAGELAREEWLAGLSQRARREPQAPANALVEVRERIEARGRGGWLPLLDGLSLEASLATRIGALGGPTLAGGSHRSAVAAMYWEGLAQRIWTALEAPFRALIEAPWQACHAAHAGARQRARELAARQRAGGLEAAETLELAGLIEALAGARAAHPLWRLAYARARTPQAALGLARTLLVLEPIRAREALRKLAAHPCPEVALAAQQLSRRAALPTTR